MGIYAVVEAHVMEVAKDGSTEVLPRLLAYVPAEQVAMPIATKAAASNITYVGRAVDSALTQCASATLFSFFRKIEYC